MKTNWKLIKLLLAGAMPAALLTGCGSSGTAVENVGDAEELFGCSVINVYNAGEYIADNVVPDFEKMYNATVNYDVFESNEIMYTKLMGGSSYDVIVPSDYMIERMISEKMLQPIDQDAMTNLDQINPDVLEKREAYDPGGVYSVPYFWGSVGLVYNKTVVDPDLIKQEGWDILLDEQFKGRIYAYDSQRDMFMIAFKALGYSMNTDDPDEIQAAYEWLQNMNETTSPAYVTDEVIDGMANGDMDIAVMYSGDAAYVLSENPDMDYIEPDQGTNIWYDAMVIPANAECPGLAKAFINYITDYNTALANSTQVGYTSPNLQVMNELSSEDGDYYENSAYIPREGYDKDEVFHYNAELTRQLADLWTRVKMSVN